MSGQKKSSSGSTAAKQAMSEHLLVVNTTYIYSLVSGYALYCIYCATRMHYTASVNTELEQCHCMILLARYVVAIYDVWYLTWCVSSSVGVF